MLYLVWGRWSQWTRQGIFNQYCLLPNKAKCLSLWPPQSLHSSTRETPLPIWIVSLQPQIKPFATHMQTPRNRCTKLQEVSPTKSLQPSQNETILCLLARRGRGSLQLKNISSSSRSEKQLSYLWSMRPMRLASLMTESLSINGEVMVLKGLALSNLYWVIIKLLSTKKVRRCTSYSSIKPMSP
jgi:hypothetical protein